MHQCAVLILKSQSEVREDQRQVVQANADSVLCIAIVPFWFMNANYELKNVLVVFLQFP